MTREKHVQLPILDVALSHMAGVGGFKMFSFKLEDLSSKPSNVQ